MLNVENTKPATQKTGNHSQGDCPLRMERRKLPAPPRERLQKIEARMEQLHAEILAWARKRIVPRSLEEEDKKHEVNGRLTTKYTMTRKANAERLSPLSADSFAFP